MVHVNTYRGFSLFRFRLSEIRVLFTAIICQKVNIEIPVSLASLSLSAMTSKPPVIMTEATEGWLNFESWLETLPASRVALSFFLDARFVAFFPCIVPSRSRSSSTFLLASPCLENILMPINPVRRITSRNSFNTVTNIKIFEMKTDSLCTRRKWKVINRKLKAISFNKLAAGYILIVCNLYSQMQSLNWKGINQKNYRRKKKVPLTYFHRVLLPSYLSLQGRNSILRTMVLNFRNLKHHPNSINCFIDFCMDITSKVNANVLCIAFHVQGAINSFVPIISSSVNTLKVILNPSSSHGGERQ